MTTKTPDERSHMPPTITSTVRCQHCATAFETRRPKQAKWCPKCGAAKGIIALAEYPRKCVACDQPYFKHTRKQSICLTCSQAPVGVTQPEKPCHFCDGTERMMPDTKVCYPCAARVGKVHGVIVSALAKLLRESATVSP